MSLQTGLKCLRPLSVVGRCQDTGDHMNGNGSHSETIVLLALWLQKKKHVIHARNCLLQGGFKVDDEGLGHGLGGYTMWWTGCNSM